MKEKLEEIAQKIIKASNIPEDNYSSVLLVLMTISIMIGAIRAIQECNKKSKLANSKYKAAVYREQIKTLSINQGWFTKMRLKKIIRQNMKTEEYKLYGAKMVDAILEFGSKISEDEAAILLQASESKN